ncbi:hypothetical protein BC828DRAFT_387138 [Blastocladiella britannica]|nr:hypothetical protein BC828DRAFT_387138 [Blastocladiella britannica]
MFTDAAIAATDGPLNVQHKLAVGVASFRLAELIFDILAGSIASMPCHIVNMILMAVIDAALVWLHYYRIRTSAFFAPSRWMSFGLGGAVVFSMLASLCFCAAFILQITMTGIVQSHGAFPEASVGPLVSAVNHCILTGANMYMLFWGPTTANGYHHPDAGQLAKSHWTFGFVCVVQAVVAGVTIIPTVDPQWGLLHLSQALMFYTYLRMRGELAHLTTNSVDWRGKSLPPLRSGSAPLMLAVPQAH